MRNKYNLDEATMDKVKALYSSLKNVPKEKRDKILKSSLPSMLAGAKKGLTKKGTAIAAGVGGAAGVGVSYLKNRKKIDELKNAAEVEKDPAKKVALLNQASSLRNRMVTTGLAGAAVGAGANIARHAAKNYGGAVSVGAENYHLGVKRKNDANIKAIADRAAQEAASVRDSMAKAQAARDMKIKEAKAAAEKAAADKAAKAAARAAAAKELATKRQQKAKNASDIKNISAAQNEAQKKARAKYNAANTPKGQALGKVSGAVDAGKKAVTGVVQEPIDAAKEKIADVAAIPKKVEKSFWGKVGGVADSVRNKLDATTPAPTNDELIKARTEKTRRDMIGRMGK